MICAAFWKWHIFEGVFWKIFDLFKRYEGLIYTTFFFNFKTFFFGLKTQVFFNGEIDVLESHAIKTWIVIYLNTKRNLEV